MKDSEFEFRIDVFYPTEFREKFYELMNNEKSKGNLIYYQKLVGTAPPPELIKDIVIITASSLTIIKHLYDFWKEIKKKNGRVMITANGETMDLEAHGIDEVKIKIRLNRKQPTRKYFCRLPFPSMSQEEIMRSARTLANRPIVFDGNGLPFPDNRVFFAEEASGDVEAIIYVRDREINELYDKKRTLYAKADFKKVTSMLHQDKQVPIFTTLLVSKTATHNSCKMKEIVRNEDYPEWYRP